MPHAIASGLVGILLAVAAASATWAQSFPARRITVNLAPAELSKQGGRFDLPVALALLIIAATLYLTRRSHRKSLATFGRDASIQ